MFLANNTHNKDDNGFIPFHMFLPICFCFALNFNFDGFIEVSWKYIHTYIRIYRENIIIQQVSSMIPKPKHKYW